MNDGVSLKRGPTRAWWQKDPSPIVDARFNSHLPQLRNCQGLTQVVHFCLHIAGLAQAAGPGVGVHRQSRWWSRWRRAEGERELKSQAKVIKREPTSCHTLSALGKKEGTPGVARLSLLFVSHSSDAHHSPDMVAWRASAAARGVWRSYESALTRRPLATQVVTSTALW